MEYTETIHPIYYLYMTYLCNTVSVVDGCLEKGRVAVGDWNPMEIELYEDLKFMHSTMPVKIIENRSEDDTHFVVQGEGDEVYFTAYPVG